ncbi:DegQ family serine endoprotease [Coralloluteibacterium stylophorae]|uniref:Probable periplasmic serine endoprotease DegP-like n=1 Tax=Coralloluteibacterium stylophorae TaxID=1776034 RepID=A0AAP2G1Z3_9GAMM|nr:DegQ family serine endoprotease [Coralloluteibacterium stylophorae]MBS7458610.1 DegQ family serine endoprotease [Coralloluteibacterium stylophorae]
MTAIRRFSFACVLFLFAAAASAATVNLPDFSPLVRDAAPAVVNIEATQNPSAMSRGGYDDEEMPEFFRRFFGPGMPTPPSRGGTSLGSGFIISADGYVLTNHHVVDGADDITVRLNDRRELSAELIGSDPQSDIALLKVKASGLPVLKTGRSQALQPGQWVIAIGSPFGFDHSVTAGIVSATGRSNPYAPDQQYVPFIQSDVAINRGNSGGPLLNTSGEVVGINSQIFSNSGGWMGVSFAIPIDVAMNAVQQIKDTGTVSRGQLGVQVQDIDQATASALDLELPRGALVVQVEPGSAADKAGIEVQDVIVGFDGQEVVRWSELPPLVGAVAPGSRVEVEVIRAGRERTLTAVLDAVGGDAVASASRRAGGASQSNPLGVVVQDLSAQERAQLGIEGDEGVVVVRVEPRVAQRTDIRRGDIVTRVGRETIRSKADFEAAVGDADGDEPVMLLLQRGGRSQFVTVTPAGH